MSAYHGEFASWNDVVANFCGAKYDPVVLNRLLKKHSEPSKVFYANYDRDDPYSGMAVVIWRDGSKYFLLTGSHCSCHGLEEARFDPEVFYSKQIFIEYLKKTRYISGLPAEIHQRLIKQLSQTKKKTGKKDSSRPL